MRRHSPLQQLHEARVIARENGMRIAECKCRDGTDYVLYRSLQDGRSARLGKRSTIPGLRSLVIRCAAKSAAGARHS